MKLHPFEFHFYTDAHTTWNHIMSACERAHTSIYIELFIFRYNTHDTHDFVELFARKARAGVQVVLLLDALGSKKLTKESLQILKASGVEVRFFLKWFSFTHRKLFLIDESIVFVGGLNIKKKYKDWLDLMVEIHGPLAYQFHKVFAKSYIISGGTNKKILSFINVPNKKLLSIEIVDQFPVLKYFKLRSHIHQRLQHAKKEVTIVTPYFVPPRWLEIEIDVLSSKGISITIIAPLRTDHIFVRHINLFYFDLFSKKGVSVYVLDQMNHAKAMILDNREAMVGSANFDNLSFNINSEIGVFFDDTRAVSSVVAIFDTWKKQATVYNPGKHGLKWYHKILLPVLWVLRPVL